MRGEQMKIIFKSIVLFTLIAVLLSIWVPHFIAGPTVSAENVPKGSTIGGVEIGELKGEELQAALTNAADEWRAQNLTVYGGEEFRDISSDTFQFDIEGTVNDYEKNYNKPWYAFWKSEPIVHLPLTVLPNEIVKNEIRMVPSWDTDLTYERVHQQASYLKTNEIEAVVVDLTLFENDRISLSIEAMPERAMGINELVYALNDTLIDAQKTFSIIEELGDAINLANREAINFVASNIYNAALHINGEILERHAQNIIPTYLKPGLEAQVDLLANKDLKFINTSSNPYLLKLSMDGGNLLTEVYTTSIETEVVVEVSRDEEIQPRTIIRYSEDLAIGQTEQLQEGVPGLRVSVYRTVYGEQQLISRDYYSPVNRILMKSAQQPEEGASSTDLNNDSIDLNGDGFPDEDFNSGDSNSNSNSNTGNNIDTNPDTAQEQLSPGGYYDKGGNYITP